MNPEATLSLDLKNTAYSVLGCFIQTGAWYIGNHQNDIAKGFAKTALRVLLKSLKDLSADLTDKRARGNIMWASCVNTMGIFRSGVDHPYPWTVFSVSYIPRVAHHVPYREALAAAYPVWLKGIPLSLSAYGACPSREFVQNSLAKEDFGEFSFEEMYGMIADCYRKSESKPQSYNYQTD